MERPTRSRKQPSRLADYEVSGDSGWVVRGRGRRGGRGLAVPNQPIRPNALTIQGQTGPLTLNELTPEEAATDNFTTDSISISRVVVVALTSRTHTASATSGLTKV
ncbi:hypothetical protein OUZ56_032073 [Daphnia magna]|uniref:Uncharacterized protein n=1 Tax=Daphnia magna TaxID=35525 RepID=A0ABQ9ZW23_9CRUS|nr:hypothetical protein OUZ56_032073 [Daphnia magna]